MTSMNQWLAVAVIGSALLVACNPGGSGSHGSTGEHPPEVDRGVAARVVGGGDESGGPKARRNAGVCGDGTRDAHEHCDDGNTTNGDGCDATCDVEPGYHCEGSPSVCTRSNSGHSCGNGVVNGAEVCDDGADNGTYGHCKADCSGLGPHCGDGTVNGAEVCDDGAANGTYGHCKADCSGLGPHCGDGVPQDGEACDDGAANGTYGHCKADCSGAGPSCGDGTVNGPEACDDGAANGSYGHCKADCSGLGPSCGDGAVNGPEACDDGNTASGDGCDGTCHIEKGFSCTGASSVCTPGCGNGTVGGSEGCDDGNTKDGDGCSSACQIEQGFTCSGTKSVCCIPEVEPNDAYTLANGPVPEDVFTCGTISDFMTDADYFSFTLPATGDLQVETYNAAGSNVACDSNTITTLDLYGPDGTTLIAHNDVSGVYNPATGAHLSYCSTIDPTYYPSVVGLPPGTYYARVSSMSTDNPYLVKFHAILCGDGLVEWSEQCDGSPSCDASCVAVAPGPGESRATAAPFPGCPTTPNSTVRLGVPSCFPQQGPVQWYSHVATDQVLSVMSDASGPIALFDSTGTEKSCSLDATNLPIATLTGGAGTTFYVAVSLPSSMTCLDFNDHPYTGLQGTLTDLNISFPSPGLTPLRQGMAVSPTQIFVGNTTALYWAAKTGNVTATKQSGLNSACLGEDLNFQNGWLFSVNPTITANVFRLKRIFDGTTFSCNTLWEASSVYPTSTTTMDAFAYDGARFIALMQGNSSSPLANPVRFASYTVATKGPVQLLQDVSPWFVVAASGIAADSRYLYVAGHGPLGDYGPGPQKEGVYRFDRANLSAPPVQIASYATISSSGPSHLGLVLDDVASPAFLYGRDMNGSIHAIINPAGVAEDVGVISTRGRAGDRGMVYDPVDHAIYFIETQTVSTGRIIKLQ